MYNTSKYKKVYIGNRRGKYTTPKVIELNKVRPYFKKVKFEQTREEKKIKLSIIAAISFGIIFLYLALVFLGTQNESDDFVKVDTGIEQNVTNVEDAERILGFKTIPIKNLPINYVQNYIKVDPTNKIYKIHFTIEGESPSLKKNILLIQKKTSLTPIIGTIDGNNAEYRTFNEESDDFSTYLNTFDNKSIINIVSWHDGSNEFVVVGDLGIEGLSKFISEVLDIEITFSISNKRNVYRR